MASFRFYTERSDYGRGLRLFIMRRRGDQTDGSFDALVQTAWTTVKDGDIGPPDLPFHEREAEDFLRAALNCAWEMGLRPDGYEDTRQSIVAMKAHLDDMRTLLLYKQAGA